MKAFVASLFALAAGAKAEADPQLLVQSPLVQTPVVASSPFIQAVASPYIATAPIMPTIAKSEEQMNKKVVNEMEYKQPVVATYAAQPAPITYTTNQVYQPYTYAAGVLPYAAAAYQPAVVRPAIQQTVYSAKNGEVEHKVVKLAKRDAEANADPFYLYNGAYTTPYVNTYSGLYNNYAAWNAAPLVNSYAANVAAPVVAPAAVASYPYHARLSTYANDAVRPNNYAAKGSYVAVNAGAIHVAKRSADADPAFYYANAVAHTPLAATTATIPYTTYNTAAISPVVSTSAYTTYNSGYYQPYAYQPYNYYF